MHLSVEAQRFEQDRAIRWQAILARAALVASLMAYDPARGRTDLGDLERRSCLRKTRYPTRADAERWRAKLRKKEPDIHGSVYGCTFCGGFHLTSQGR